MVPRKHRFHGMNSLRFVHTHGQATRGPLFVIKSAHNKRRKEFRAAIVVSKKIHKSAVVRNRIRRRLYQALREYEQLISLPYDIAIMVYSDRVAEMPSDKLHEQLKKQLKAAKII
jgi:ribonuclease P protein component